jgi:hypothetical protein
MFDRLLGLEFSNAFLNKISNDQEIYLDHESIFEHPCVKLLEVTFDKENIRKVNFNKFIHMLYSNYLSNLNTISSKESIFSMKMKRAIAEEYKSVNFGSLLKDANLKENDPFTESNNVIKHWNEFIKGINVPTDYRVLLSSQTTEELYEQIEKVYKLMDISHPKFRIPA